MKQVQDVKENSKQRLSDVFKLAFHDYSLSCTFYVICRWGNVTFSSNIF